MGHKVSPTAYRLGSLFTWKSKWLANKKNFRKFLEEDIRIRVLIMKRWREAAIANVLIERSSNMLHVIVETARPGMIIGRGGTGVEDLKKELHKMIADQPLKVTIEEVRDPEGNATLVANTVALALEKRVPFRRVIKQALERTRSQREVRGAKIMVAGRLNGSAMSRREWVSWGEIPLHNLRANIEFAQDVAQTKYGAIGVKVWAYKGEVFRENKRAKRTRNRRNI